jgi:glutathione S-transferase
MPATLVIGSKNYSSWSLRPWLLSRKAGFEFEERLIYFDAPDYQAQIAAWSPSRRVPLLVLPGHSIWDSLAICEYVAEVTGSGWPRDAMRRARARSVAAEMHSGFAALREQCPMNVRGDGRRVPVTPALQADIARIDVLWSECRERHAGAGPWLFGAFSIADAMYAPVAFRFRTYGIAPSALAAGYLATLLDDPDMQEWRRAAALEGHPLADVDRVGI